MTGLGANSAPGGNGPRNFIRSGDAANGAACQKTPTMAAHRAQSSSASARRGGGQAMANHFVSFFKLALAAGGLALAAAPAHSAPGAPINVGDLVSPRAALTLYDAAPSGIFGQAGKALGAADVAKKYRIDKTAVFRNALGQQFWVHMQQEGGASAGWGLAGDDADPARNLAR